MALKVEQHSRQILARKLFQDLTALEVCFTLECLYEPSVSTKNELKSGPDFSSADHHGGKRLHLRGQIDDNATTKALKSKSGGGKA